MNKNYQTYNQDSLIGLSQLKDNSVDLIFTDPPYGIRGDQLDQHYNRDVSQVVTGYHEIKSEDYAQWALSWIKQCERVLKPNGSMYIISGYTNLHHILNALHSTKLREVNHLICQYSFGVYTKNKWVSSHYHMLYWAKGKKHTFNTNAVYPDTKSSYNDRLTVQTLSREYQKNQIKNVNQLPVKFIEKFIKYSSNPGDTVLDPFSGSFSTGRAAHNLDRNFIGFEINSEAYQQFGSCP